MAKLSSKTRAGMKDSEFALPGHRFPIEDRSHQEAALRDAPHALHAGTISKAEEELIERKARARLDKHPTRVAIRRASEHVASKYK